MTHSIALIGCGGISAAHLAAYREAGLNVVLLCDRTLAKAKARRAEYFPNARYTQRVTDIWADESIDIVDVATHVSGRELIIEQALRAGKNVLSQKPFVWNLETGTQLVELAAQERRALAVNQNGRWAPHFAALLDAVRSNVIGDVTSADFCVYWPHDRNFEHDTRFSRMTDLVLFDFGIHWFDIVAQLMKSAGSPKTVYSLTSAVPGSRIPVDTNASVLIEFERATATILFRASSRWAESGSFRVEGTLGALVHSGASLGGRSVVQYTDAGSVEIPLDGNWWTRGMIGTMAELISALDEVRAPTNSADSVMSGLRLCFAAVASARSGVPVDPGSVTNYSA